MKNDEVRVAADKIVQLASDGYVLSDDVDCVVRHAKRLDLFGDLCREILSRGVDVVDGGYVDIYRREKGLDCGDERDEVREAITRDLKKRYDEKIAAGHQSILRKYGFASGVVFATRHK